LGIKRLGGCDGHFNVSTVRCVQNTVSFVCQVAAAAVNNGYDVASSLADEVNGAIGVGGGA
jgi:hypothetical protein